MISYYLAFRYFSHHAYNYYSHFRIGLAIIAVSLQHFHLTSTFPLPLQSHIDEPYRICAKPKGFTPVMIY